MDFLREAKFSTERLADYIDWTPVLERVKEFSMKAYCTLPSPPLNGMADPVQ